MILSQPFLVAASAALLSPGLAAGFSTELQSVLKNTHGGNEYDYPTDFTRGVYQGVLEGKLADKIRSDYLRYQSTPTMITGEIFPFTLVFPRAVSQRKPMYGFITVGHDESSLTEERTFESLYVNPMLDVLKRQNPQTRFVTSPTKNGVFDTTSSQTLYFFVDVKTSGPETFEAVISALEPLRKEGYLTSLKDNKTVTSGPITVIGTGNTPLDMVGPVANRDYFFDAHLDELEENPEITSLISPIASTSFQEAVGSVTYSEDGAVLSDEQLATLRSQISTAKERGIGARYWETPYYPIRIRNAVWRTLLQEGVALLNADDLDAVAAYF